MDPLLAFIPIDRQIALVDFTPLRTRTRGAALFADLSGFTPLAEALVQALGPQRGAEELTRQLNLVYDALIGQVENYRGTVIGFSGDAITCWFEEDNGLRALASALAMQQEMKNFAAVPIPNGGAVVLALKVAVICGAARRFTVGDPAIQLFDVLAGSILDRLAAAEHHAEKSQVVVDQTTAAALQTAIHIAAWKHAHQERFAVIDALNVHVEPLPWVHPPRGELSAEEIKPWILPAVYARLTSGQESFLAELRPAVSLFERFGGIDYDNDADAGAKLDAYVKWVQRILSKYDGILVQLTIGDKGSYMYAAFGAPVAHDDDEERALRAARELQKHAETAPELNYITPPQIGVSRGRVRVGAYGGATRRTYGVLGDEVNVAARLMQAAQPGQILVTARVRDASARVFEFEPLPPLQVKGKSEPLHAAALRGERAEPARALDAEYELPVVGRLQELQTIQANLERAAAGQVQVLVLTGEAGVGKSRLAAEAARRARRFGFDEFAGECPSYGAESSYIVWHSIWRAFFGLDKNASPETQIQQLAAALRRIHPNFERRAPLLSAALNLPIPDNDLTRSLDGRVRKQLLEALLVDCVRARALDTPLLFLLEDCHWLDALSQDLVQVLARETADRAVWFVLTLRPPDMARLQAPHLLRLSNTTLIALTDFSRDEAARLIALKLQQLHNDNRAPEPGVVEQLTARAGGNPFYLQELLNYMRDQGLDARDPHALEALDLPDSLSSLILSRIDRLSEPQRATLKIASIIGRQFPFRWLWGVYPNLGDTRNVRRDLDTTDTLELTMLDEPDPNRAYVFRHALTQQVAYESQPYALRAELHGRLGFYLEREFQGDLERKVDLLAHHFDRSEQADKRRAYLLQAGEQAQAEYANDAAISYYRRVLPLLDETARLPVMLKLGQVYEVVGAWDEASALYRDGLTLAAQLQDARVEAQCRAALGVLLRKRGDFSQAAQWLDEAQRGFENLDDRAGMGQVLNERGTLAAQQGDFDKARAFYQESLALRRALGDKRAIANLLSNLGILARMKSDYAAAAALYGEALALRREIGDRWGIAISLNNLGMLNRYQGEFAQARRTLEQALALWREIGDRANLANTLTSLGEVLIDQGDSAAAREHLTESLNTNRVLGDKRAIAFLLENFARAALLEDDAPRALQLIGAASALRQTIGAALPQTEQANLDQRLQTLRAQLGDDAYTTLLQQGRELSLEQAIAFALKT